MRVLLYSLVLLFCVSWTVNAQESVNGPKAQVQQTVDAILEQLRADSVENVDRRETISELIHAKFDFLIMAQGALGRNWKAASTEDRAHFVALFSSLLEETYLGRIQAYTDEKVSYGAEKIRKNRAVVDTFIHTASVDIPISYKLLPHDRDWLVYDVVIEEVSLIRNYRSSYATILRKKGMTGLLEEMQQKLEHLRKRNDSESEDAA
ncbi:MAG: ABC transporter substrate-binding protein [Desulfuromonas sp.]|nr:ABC transporter substrate-binding protein [Desulfuromonas sp.]